MLNVFRLIDKQILLIFVILMEALSNDCLVGMCTRRYIDLMDELVLQPTSSLQYCQILNEYVKCLDEIKNKCRSLLEFHSAITTSQQNFREFECKKFKKFMGQLDEEDRCQIMKPDQQKTCAFYGFGHLRQINGQIETCKPSGSQTLVDNKFFLIQLTTLPMSNKKELAIVSRVTIIFRPIYLCKESRQYQTDLNDIQLSPTFTDGTNYAGNEKHPSIVVEKQRDSSIRIWARHLATQIYIVKVDNRISVVLNAPEKILYSEHFDQSASKQICLNGCPYTEHNLSQALTNPNVYAKCQFNSKPCMDKFIAYDKCQQTRVRNTLHSSCAFDLMYGQCENVQNYLHQWHELIRLLRTFQALRSRPLKLADPEIDENQCKNGSMKFGFLSFLYVLLAYLLTI